ncbi:hypothetical protein [Actinoplanes sp. NPDC049802]|uniref:hypothetical protein n=1 Tax=Actinoplanes sp. NPDC049802 TaxID=3154742 RepID=UPI0033C89009
MRTGEIVPLRARVARIAMAGVAGLSMLAMAPTAAQAADAGDGNLACNVGEICLKKNWDTKYTTAIKHFWYSQRHDDFSWGGGGSGTVQYAASMWVSRDTSCTIYVVDGYGGETKMDTGSSYARLYLWNDGNYAHSRCSVHQRWGT